MGKYEEYNKVKEACEKIYEAIINGDENCFDIYNSLEKDSKNLFRKIFNYLYGGLEAGDIVLNVDMEPEKKLDMFAKMADSKIYGTEIPMSKFVASMIEDENSIEFFNRYADMISERNLDTSATGISIASPMLSVFNSTPYNGYSTFEEALENSSNQELKDRMYGFYETMFNYNNEWEKTPSKIETAIGNTSYSGKEYSVEQHGEIITVTDENGNKRQIDLDEICKEGSGLRKLQLKQAIQNCPGEVLWSMSIELAKGGITLGRNNATEGASGNYWSHTDSINIADGVTIGTLVHELGHAIDFYPGADPYNTDNFSFVYDNPTIKELYNQERENFLKSEDANKTFYALKNVMECFAEVYTMLMLGKTSHFNDDIFVKYFPRTIDAMVAHLAKVMDMPDEQRTI